MGHSQAAIPITAIIPILAVNFSVPVLIIAAIIAGYVVIAGVLNLTLRKRSFALGSED